MQWRILGNCCNSRKLFSNRKKARLFTYLFSFATKAGSPQQREPNTVSPYYLIPPPPLSTFPVGGVPGKNPRLSGDRWLHSFHMNTGFESTLRWTLNRTHYTTEAPSGAIHHWNSISKENSRKNWNTATEFDNPETMLEKINSLKCHVFDVFF